MINMIIRNEVKNYSQITSVSQLRSESCMGSGVISGGSKWSMQGMCVQVRNMIL